MKKTSVLLVCLVSILSIGCNGGGLVSGVSQDIVTLLKDPNVQKTIQHWDAEADATNPSVGFEFYQGGRIKADGFILRGKGIGKGPVPPGPAPTPEQPEPATQPEGTVIEGSKIKIGPDGKPIPQA